MTDQGSFGADLLLICGCTGRWVSEDSHIHSKWKTHGQHPEKAARDGNGVGTRASVGS